MAIAKQSDQKSVDELALTYEDAGNLLLNGAHPLTGLSDPFGELLRISGGALHARHHVRLQGRTLQRQRVVKVVL